MKTKIAKIERSLQKLFNTLPAGVIYIVPNAGIGIEEKPKRRPVRTTYAALTGRHVDRYEMAQGRALKLVYVRLSAFRV